MRSRMFGKSGLSALVVLAWSFGMTLQSVTTAAPVVDAERLDAMTSGAAARLADVDRDVMRQLVSDGMLDADMALLAQRRATRPEIRAQATAWAQARRDADSALQRLAAAKNVSLPLEPSSQHRKTLERLARTDSASFDRELLLHLVRDRHSDMAAFQQAALSRDADLRALAVGTLAALQARAAEVRQASLTALARPQI